MEGDEVTCIPGTAVAVGSLVACEFKFGVNWHAVKTATNITAIKMVILLFISYTSLVSPIFF